MPALAAASSCVPSVFDNLFNLLTCASVTISAAPAGAILDGRGWLSPIGNSNCRRSTKLADALACRPGVFREDRLAPALNSARKPNNLRLRNLVAGLHGHLSPFFAVPQNHSSGIEPGMLSG